MHFPENRSFISKGICNKVANCISYIYVLKRWNARPSATKSRNENVT